MTLHVVPQAHIDMAWWWRYDPHTIRVIVRRTLEMAFANLEAFPDYTFTFLQVPAIRPMETLDPDLFYRIHYYLFHSAPIGSALPNPHGPAPDSEKGRFKIASGLWLELDPAVPSGESLVRQCLYGKRYYKYEFGLDVKSAWFQDAWTHPWTYPQILKKSGIESYMFNRGEAGKNDERMFWWEAPDGSRVFAYKPANPAGQLSRDGVRSEMAEVALRYGVKDHIALVGVGNHGGGANSKDVAEWRKTMPEISPGTHFSMHTKFLSAVLAKPDRFPVVRDEITPTIRGAYTTVAEIKKKHRESEDLLLTLEKFSSIAAQMRQAPYPQRRLNAFWEKLMLNQFHDTISGTDIPPATDDALRLFQEILDSGRKDLGQTLGAISARINTAGQGTPVVLFNPLSWTRTDVAEVELESSTPFPAAEASDSSGLSIPVQVVRRDDRDGTHFVTLLFIAEDVPSLGYKTYHLSAAAASRPYATSLKAIHSIRYALYPHEGSWQGAGTVQRGYELNSPLLSYLTAAHSGDLPPAHSFVTVEPKNLIVEVLKRAEDSEQQYILRLYETEGKQSTAKITWTQQMDAVHHTDLLETSTADLATDGRSIQAPIGAYSIESFKLIKDLDWPVR